MPEADETEAPLSASAALRSISERLRGRDVFHLYVRLCFAVFKAQTTAQYSVGFLTLLGWVVAFAASPKAASSEFYSTAAEAITTLLLTLAFTAYWFRLQRFRGPRAWIREHAREEDLASLSTALPGLRHKQLADEVYRVIDRSFGAWTRASARWVFRFAYGVLLLASLVVGEVCALVALMNDDPQKAALAQPVFAAVVAGLLGIGIVALLGTPTETT